MLTFAQGQGWVAQNVARGVKLKADKRSAAAKLKEGVDFPSKAEIRALLDTVSDRWRAFFVVAIFTGLRASELRGLRWADVDLDAGKLTVSQRADAWRGIRRAEVRGWQARNSARTDGDQCAWAMEATMRGR